jgi:hypothetical protein
MVSTLMVARESSLEEAQCCSESIRSSLRRLRFVATDAMRICFRAQRKTFSGG